ncbi:putative NADPH-quinone reductase [Acidovorax soli]|uniref:Putative NADPH-quinone reductase n=1 Tax=Acidovorax soli TaxID=592050 RepID=A0A7X0UCV9_9BURK|nr:NAD(P)H-dependent oxidoreductase [Acidovorax soli]MBB6563837.1 putative NADPH-quinone reductase [Acidovorax soli]
MTDTTPTTTNAPVRTIDTLVLLFHPRFAQSATNRALADAAAAVPGVQVVDMAALYPEGRAIDGDAEVRRLLSARRVVLQFPVQWYSSPPLLKAWQDAVLTRMFYMAYASEGRHLEGTPLLVAATAGNVPEAYTPTGQNLFSLAELLRPLQATAHRCGLPWAEPFLVYRAGKMDAAQLAGEAARYAARLRAWGAEAPAGAPAGAGCAEALAGAV